MQNKGYLNTPFITLESHNYQYWAFKNIISIHGIFFGCLDFFLSNTSDNTWSEKGTFSEFQFMVVLKKPARKLCLKSRTAV